MATYTLAEVEKHKDSQSGVWMVIHGKVYDVSKFLDEVSIVDHFIDIRTCILFSTN